MRFPPLAAALLLGAAATALAGTARAATISGVVFEDVNYGGGAGRPRATSGTVALANVRVELYRVSDGALDAATTTDATGAYSFTFGGNAARVVRVVNGTVRSSRSGGAACTTCVPVQTFRTTGSGDTAVADTNRVGGENPALSDAPTNNNGTLASLTSATRTPQSIATFSPVANGSTITGADFGYNFATIVGVRDAATCTPSGQNNTFFPCQGTLRQFVINANALGGEGLLLQSGSGRLDNAAAPLPSGFESTIFMIPRGVAVPGHAAGYANQLNASGVAVITLAAALPDLTSPSVRLDASTQTVNVGDSNAGTLGTGGTVGVDAIALPTFARPEVQLDCAAAGQIVLRGTNDALVGFALRQGYVLLAGSSQVARNNLVGMTATGSSADNSPAAYGITFSGSNALVRNNFVTVNNSAIRSDGGGTGSLVTLNEVARPSSGHTATFDGILLIGGASSITISANLVRNQRGGGIELGFGAQSDVYTGIAVTNNTSTQNGFDAGTTASTEPLGMVSYNYTAPAGGVVYSRNVVTDNAGPGLAIMTANGTVVTQNRFSGNGGLAIDLDERVVDPNGYGSGPGVTRNDAGDADTGPNGLLNFPVITSARIANGELALTGYARPGSAIELYVAAADPTGFGEGRTYLLTLTEGSAADLATTTASYGPAAINGLLQGTDTTAQFAFRIALPPGVAVGTVLTSTATLAGQTSEFGGNVVVTSGPTLVHTNTVSVLSDPVNATTNPKSIPGSVQAYVLRVTNTGTGSADAGTVAVVAPVPANTELYVGDLTTPGTGPVAYTDGTPPTGLTYTYSGLASTTDLLDFSNDGGATWTYVPTANAQGFDPAVTHLRVRPAGTLAAASGSGNPWFELRFRVRVK